MSHAAAAPDALGSQRASFRIPEGVTYLNCASMSPQLRAVTRAGSRSLRAREAPWTLGARDWFSGAERLRELFGSIVGADAEGISLVPSASYGIATAAANVEVRRGQSIVLLEQQFPSNFYAWQRLAARRGARIRSVRRDAGESWAEAVVGTIDGETAVVAVPSCHWTDGGLVDLARVGRAARAAGAALVVDASQSAGAYPLDVSEIQPDFLVSVGYKWLLGPYGLGYLYAAPRYRETGVPIEESWLTRSGSDDFARLVDYTDAYRAGARRFDMGEFPHLVLAPMAIAALEQVRSWGVPRIQAALSDLTSRACREVTALGGVAPPLAERVGHMAGIRLAGGLPGAVKEALAAARVHVGIRGDSIRVAPHLYNDEADIDRFVSVLRRGIAAP